MDRRTTRYDRYDYLGARGRLSRYTFLIVHRSVVGMESSAELSSSAAFLAFSSHCGSHCLEQISHLLNGYEYRLRRILRTSTIYLMLFSAISNGQLISHIRTTLPLTASLIPKTHQSPSIHNGSINALRAHPLLYRYSSQPYYLTSYFPFPS